MSHYFPTVSLAANNNAYSSSPLFQYRLPLFLPSICTHLSSQQQSRFNQMSTTIIGRIDEMGNRIDDLEKSISDLMQQVWRWIETRKVQKWPIITIRYLQIIYLPSKFIVCSVYHIFPLFLVLLTPNLILLVPRNK